MAKVTGGRLAAKALKREGVECFFYLMGGHIAAIAQGCREEGIRAIDVRHEQAAGHAAEGWAKVTGKPGVAVVTAGPGVTDTVTAVASAFQTGCPMLVLGGRSAIDALEMGPLQEMNHEELMKPITKWSRTVYETRRIPEYISMAYRHALAGRPGPVFLDCPEDVFGSEVEESEVFFPQPETSRASSRVLANPELVGKAARLLAEAQTPVVIAGSTVHWSQASQELQRFAEAINAPVYLNAMGRGCLHPDHPLLFVFTRMFALNQADVVVIIGTPIDFRLNYGRPPLFREDAKIIQIDIDQTEIGRNRPIDVGIMADTGEVLKQLIDELQRREVSKGPGWVESVRQREEEMGRGLEPHSKSEAVPIHPMRLIREIRDFLDKDAIVVADGGGIVTNAAQILKIYHPGHWLDTGRMGCLGVGTGFAIAAKLAEPEKQVLIVYGDGSFGLNGMEIDTAVRHNLPFVAVIGNNGGWGSTRGDASAGIGERLGFSHYEKIAEAFGAYSECVEKPQDIRPALERAFSSGLPAVINVMIDPTEGAGGVAQMSGISAVTWQRRDR